MAFAITNRAFKFTVSQREFALDIQNDGVIYDRGYAVHLFEKVPDGWHRSHEAMEPVLYVTERAVEDAGGLEAFCRVIVDKVNRALRIVLGNVENDDLPPPTRVHEVVMDYLRNSLTVVNGQLVMADG